jgi:hypothetical protein
LLDNLTVVEYCPADLKTFTVVTELVLTSNSSERRLSNEEMLVLEIKLQNVYNQLTVTNCDSYFRRLINFTMLNMDGMDGMDDMDMDMGGMNMSMGGMTMTMNMTEGDDEPTNNSTMRRTALRRRQRNLQQSDTMLPEEQSLVNSSSLQDPAPLSVMYEVTGTCRGCPITQGGTIDLYDEAFRRQLLRAFHTVEERNTQETSVFQISNAIQDCTCLEGTSPDTPYTPGVQECVALMNDELDMIELEQGLFENLRMIDLLQLDDLSELQEEASNATSSVTDTEEETTNEEQEEDGSDAITLIDVNGGTEEEEEEEEIPVEDNGDEQQEDVEGQTLDDYFSRP